ncbi:response regulator [Aliagarivorans marinus]|uniref:response regulator n=1 Tax=Aliagarivorans marinus TaxID=561965 RepID=UPI00040A23D1|nr:response regulator [Aliagarivorans marinus]
MNISTSRIIVVFDSHEIIDIIRQLLTPSSAPVVELPTTLGEEESKPLLNEFTGPQLIIYAFADPKSAITAKQQIDSLLDAPLSYFRSILFCDKDQRQLAYKACFENHFDIYDTIRPVYDVGRVRLLIKRSIEWLNQQVEQAKQIEELEARLEEFVDTEEEEQTPLEQVLDEIPRAEWEKALESVLSSLEVTELNGLLEKLPQETLTQGVMEVKNPESQMLTDFSQAIDKIRKGKANRKSTVIVAEDHPVMQNIVASILEREAYHVERAGNGAEALFKAKVMQPKLLILDIDMPTLDGFNTLKALRECPATLELPVIMLTSHSDKDIFRQCIQSGAQDYIVKPTNASTLIKKVEKLIASKGGSNFQI